MAMPLVASAIEDQKLFAPSFLSIRESFVKNGLNVAEPSRRLARLPTVDAPRGKQNCIAAFFIEQVQNVIKYAAEIPESIHVLVGVVARDDSNLANG
jgi:hypothetical protein